MIFGNCSYRATLNIRYIQLVNDGIITVSLKEIVNKYINDNEIKELIIDSKDSVNGNCNKEYTGKSHKLHKQAVRSTGHMY
jgi:hypothetical protein